MDDDDDDDDDALLTSALTVSSSHGVDEVLSTVREIDTELLSKVMRRGESEDEEEDENDEDGDDDDAVATTDSETECRVSNWDIFVLNSIRSVRSAKSSSNTVTIREVIIALLRSHK